MIVPGSKAPLLGVRQPGYEMFAGIRACITETIRAPGYRSPLAERHPSAPVGSRAPWAKDLTNEETRELGRRLLCEAPLDFKDNDADEFVDILLSRIHPFTAWAAAAHACKERGIVSRTRHVLRAAENRGLNVGGLELAAELDERAAALPEQLIINAMRRSFAQGAGERARTLARTLND